MSRNEYGTNQGTNEDDSQSDPHPDSSTSQSQTPRSSGPDDAYDTTRLSIFFHEEPNKILGETKLLIGVEKEQFSKINIKSAKWKDIE